ncbi:MAG: 5'-nucleotidase C-terminal domain-containing protein [Calditrichia bacterium]|nr:5'-nucleotidase C-terminal domain-containing protein [Calditrichia bacterium]
MYKTGIIFILLLSLAFQLSAKEKIKTLTILFNNDIHGGIVETKAEFLNPEFPPLLGGGAGAYTIIKDVRKMAEKDGRVVFLSDAGDVFQGTAIGTKSKGQAVVKYFNYIGVDWVTVGNHEFDLGRDNLQKLVEQSNMPWIAANIIDKTTGKPWSVVKQYIIKEAHGLKIGITGICTAATEQMAFPDNIKNLKFLPEIPVLQKMTDMLKNELGVDIVIAVVHTGLPYNKDEGFERLQASTYDEVKDVLGVGAMKIAHYVKGIDILFGGHIHKGYDKPWEDPETHTLCFQNYGKGGNIGWIDFKIDVENKMIVGYEMPVINNTLLLLTQDAYRVDTGLYRMLEKERAKYEKGLTDIVGKSEFVLFRGGGESLMGNVVADALLEQVNADFAFTNGGGIRADLKAGSVSYKDLFNILPFGNQLIISKVKGSFIKRIIEEKVKGYSRGLVIGGGKVVVDYNRPDGDRVTQFLIKGEELNLEKEYRIVTSDYLMEGNSGLKILLEIHENDKLYPGYMMLDALVNYVKKHTPIAPELDGRWKVIHRRSN